MLLSHNPATRRDYQTMFQEKSVRKTYHAVAPTRTDLVYPLDVASRMVRGEQFFTTQEIEGEPNAHTTVELIENRGEIQPLPTDAAYRKKTPASGAYDEFGYAAAK